MEEPEEVSSPKRRLMEAQAQDQQILQQVNIKMHQFLSARAIFLWEGRSFTSRNRTIYRHLAII